MTKGSDCKVENWVVGKKTRNVGKLGKSVIAHVDLEMSHTKSNKQGTEVRTKPDIFESNMINQCYKEQESFGRMFFCYCCR